MAEITRMADYLCVLKEGAIVSSGPITNILSQLNFPLNLGEDLGVIVEGSVSERDQQWGLSKITFPGGDLWYRDDGQNLGDNARVRVLARDVSLSTEYHGESSIINSLN